MTLSRDAILAASDLREAEVNVLEWGGAVRLRELSGAERGDFERKLAELTKAGLLARYYRALVVIATVIGEDGKRLFSFDDLDAVSAKSGTALDIIAAKADELTKLSDAQIEDLAKN